MSALPYARRFGAFTPIVSLLASLSITLLIKTPLEHWLPNGWKLAILPLGIVIFVLAYCTIYVLYLAFIEIFQSADVSVRLQKHWREFLLSEESGPSPSVEDYADRVSAIHMRLAKPATVKQAIGRVLEEQRSSAAALQKTVDAYKANSTLSALINVLTAGSRLSPPFALTPPQAIDDPIHGCIVLDEVLSTIVAQPIVQRLARVRQLSFSYTRFPSATHSRLSHVLGVAHNVQRALEGIFSRGVYYEEGSAGAKALPLEILGDQKKIIQRAKLLAILHDLGHGPFGHALDNYVGYVNKHQATANPDKTYSRLYVKRYLSVVLEKVGFEPDDLMRVLNPEDRAELVGFDSLIGDLIDSSMDMDRMDYLLRDAHMTGLSMGFTNSEALIQCIRPVRVDDAYLLGYDESGVPYMEHMLYAREAMYRSCYEHPSKRAAERIFERLIRAIANDDPELIDDLYMLTDDEMMCSLRLVDLGSDLAKGLLDQLAVSAEYVVVHSVGANSPTISEEAKVWVKGTAKGKGKASYIDQPAQWEDTIARASIGAKRAHEIQLIVAPPAAYDPKFNAATILYRRGGVYRTEEFFDVASGVKDVLSAMNPARAQIRLMCSRNLNSSDLIAVRKATSQELGS